MLEKPAETHIGVDVKCMILSSDFNLNCMGKKVLVESPQYQIS
jgi:hypothetical protein